MTAFSTREALGWSLPRIRARLRRIYGSDRRTDWPRPAYRVDGEPHFLFILTPPYSGSTALAQILNTCHGTAFLHRKAEGQWLVPGLRAEDRWDPHKEIDWTSVRAVWMERIELVRSLVGRVDLIIEKSPPNLVRLDGLIDTFPNHTLLAFNRNPFARCSSVLCRKPDPTRLTEPGRFRVLEDIAERWLVQAKWIRKWIEEKGIPFFTYESFCADPAACIAPLADRLPLLSNVDISSNIRVKDYQPQKLANQNVRQIAMLRCDDILAIAKVLRKDAELVAFFGYDPSGRDEFRQAAAQ
jgi:hypothetical protein